MRTLEEKRLFHLEAEAQSTKHYSTQVMNDSLVYKRNVGVVVRTLLHSRVRVPRRVRSKDSFPA